MFHVNNVYDTIRFIDPYVHSPFSTGLQSINYIANASISGTKAAESAATKALFISTFVTNVVFVSIGKCISNNYSNH